jgi:DNA-directed RNA polymerase subunit RPC12/RpoP
MHTLTAGNWYLMFVCERCKTRQVLFPDLSDGTSKVKATYNVLCPKCGYDGSYNTDSIERYQHVEESSQAVA